MRRAADARDGRVWRVYLTDEVEPAMRTLRTVAAEMTMEEMHEKRGEYVKRVRAVVAADLLLHVVDAGSESSSLPSDGFSPGGSTW